MSRRDLIRASAFGFAASAISAGFPSLKTGMAADHRAKTGIFPFPAKASMLAGEFVLNAEAAIAIPAHPSADELFLARSLRNELADWFGLILRIDSVQKIDPQQRAIVLGTAERPLVRDALHRAGTSAIERNLAENYSLHVRPDIAVVAGTDFRGALYGLHSLRQLLSSQPDRLSFAAADVEDGPRKSFRGIKLYVPGHANIPFFKRFVRDFMAAYKYNTLILELNAGMRLESHPELNAGWREMVLDTNYSRRNYPPGALHGREQNSCHQDTADGGFIEKEELAELAAWVRSHGIELVPELPSFTHSYYLLTRHRDLSEVPGDKWPDTYCPSNPETYKLLFEVYAEYIDLLKPIMLHTGRDELFAPVGLCPRCKDRDIGERFGEDVSRVHEYLHKKDIRMAMWGDMLLESVRGSGLKDKRAPDGWSYKVAGALTPAQVSRYVPKDTLIFNWFWNKEEGEWSEEQAENHEAILDNEGFEQIFGNFSPDISNYPRRSMRRTILGGAPSAWFATTDVNFGKYMLTDFLGCSNLLWSGEAINATELSALAQARMAETRARFNGCLPPSATESSITPVDISRHLNTAGAQTVIQYDLRGMRPGLSSLGRIPFRLTNSKGHTAVAVAVNGTTRIPLPPAVTGIAIAADVSGLIFLHACAKPSSNQDPDRLLWDISDSADLLGWYEIVYRDGFVTTIPIRYGVNIAETSWEERKSARDYCYQADPVHVGESDGKRITFFAFEWVNPRLGKVVAAVNLRGTSRFESADPDYSNHYGPTIAGNAILLAAVSVVNRRA